MFYRLKSDYLLRGWYGMSWVLVQRPSNQVKILAQNMFQILTLCDGETELSDEVLDDTLKDALRQCLADDLVEACAEAHPLAPEQYYVYYPNRYVEKVLWSITGRCNFRCRHCYMDAPDAMLGELSTSEALDLIDQMAACGVLQVALTGGEPLMRQDFWQLVDRILSHGMVISQLNTNGWLLNETVLDAFARRGVKPSISISFDGVGWHDWMRGIPGAEEATLRVCRLCRERGLFVHAAMCIHRGNVDTIPQTVQALHDAGVTSLKTANIDETDLWRRHSDGNALTYQEYMEAMIPYIDWYYRAGRPIQRLELGGVASLHQNAPGELLARNYDGTEKCLDCYLCGAVRWSCYITPDGRLLPCMPMTSSPDQNRFPKIQDIGMQKGLSDSYYMQFVNGRVKDLLAVNSECAACDYRYKCGGGCRAHALIEPNGDLMGCDRHMCIFWKNGYEKRILDAIHQAESKYGQA